MPNGKPALWHFSPAWVKNSQVQAASSSLSGGAPGGYILVTSSPACSFIRSMRAQGGDTVLDNDVDTATQRPFSLPRYSAPSLTGPSSLVNCAIRSSTG